MLKILEREREVWRCGCMRCGYHNGITVVLYPEWRRQGGPPRARLSGPPGYTLMLLLLPPYIIMQCCFMLHRVLWSVVAELIGCKTTLGLARLWRVLAEMQDCHFLLFCIPLLGYLGVSPIRGLLSGCGCNEVETAAPAVDPPSHTFIWWNSNHFVSFYGVVMGSTALGF